MEGIAGEQAARRLEDQRRRVVVGDDLDPALQQAQRDEHRREEQDQEDRRLDQRPGLDRAEAHRHPRAPQQRGDVDEQREADHRGELPRASQHVHADEQGHDRDHRDRQRPAHDPDGEVAEQDPAPVGGREHQPPREAELEVGGDREADEDPAEGRGLDEHEAVLEGRVARRVVEARHARDGRQAAREPGEEDQREDQRREDERRVGEVVVQAAPGDRAGGGDHVRSIRPRRARVRAAGRAPRRRWPRRTSRRPRTSPSRRP